MCDTGGGKEHIPGEKRLSGAAADKLTAALSDDVYFVSRIRLPEIRAKWARQLNYERTMLEHRDIMFAEGTGQTAKRVRKIKLQAFAAGHGDDRNNTLECEPQTNWRLE
ncbi:MAG TPA: hypothetical protein VKD91_09725 [Pyrinomonadaceae bacterium]|nr:hypothetical protein [Pyrinomonadaceae bacterium]